jgi:FKBP-type peptidyl-prolyl cis-trans isomerase FkpA
MISFNVHPMNNFKGSVFVLIIILTVSAAGCKTKYRQQEIPAASTTPNQESLYLSNQSMIRENASEIRKQAAGKGWNLTETGTGVFYQILSANGKMQAKSIVPGDRVSLVYKLSLLDGTECYSSKIRGLKQFVVEKSEAEPGLHEAVQYLHQGDSALIVIPPHRAFGLTGDGDRIPPRAILIYEIRVDSVVRHRTD